MAVMVTEERRAELWQRAERIRMGFDAVRLTREALAREREQQLAASTRPA
ncbi:hypothetical protein [Streptomyces sp. NPDC048341]